ncbi:Hypothetical protein NTJ_01127 [Nesidiocoris tenuis]|uniref:Mannosyltransferase n=1 Tax=Nesidiocoris tenuis TaxID=355587 RepID=A0ABN7ABW9_9HEMI|nr:Hypothetical protein NTJ_01127 [Nesidiocoris tenuis]
MALRGGFSLSLALAYGTLSSSSAWAIWATRDFLLAPFGFAMYLLNGILGLVAYGMEDNTRVHRIHKAVLLSGLSLSLPLFSSQLYLDQQNISETGPSRNLVCQVKDESNGGNKIADEADYVPSLSLLLSIHLAPLLAQVTLVRHLSPRPFHTVYLASLAYASWERGYYYGLSTAASLLIAIYLIGPFGMVYSVPCRVLFNFALSFSVYFLVQMFRGH